MKIIEKCKKTIAKYHMLTTGDKVMVALSGGADSVCLLHGLLSIKDELGITLCAAHLNHNLRGKEEGEREAEFTRALSEGLGVPCVFGSADVKAYTYLNRKLSIQQAARELRYKFLREKAKEQGAMKIALGHNANDQAETILINLLRGAGARGLSGIPPVREGIYIRPLIEVDRREIEKYLVEHKVEYVNDPSNLKRDYLRNRVRLELIPSLERDYNPRLVQRLVNMGDILREENSAIEQSIKELMSDAFCEDSPNCLKLNIPDIMKMPLAFRRRAIRHILRRMGVKHTSMDSTKLVAIESLLTWQKSGKSLQLAKDLKAMIEFDRLVICRGEDRRKEQLCLKLLVPGVTPLPDRKARLVAEIRGSRPFALSSGRDRAASIDYDKLCGALILRNRRAGDRFSPLGMQGAKKLKEYLLDLRVPASERDEVLLLTDEKGIIWVVEGRISERVKITSETKRFLHLTLESGN